MSKASAEQGTIFIEGIIAITFLLIILSALFDFFFYSTSQMALTHIAREGLRAGLVAPSQGTSGFAPSTSAAPAERDFIRCTDADPGNDPSGCGDIMVVHRVHKLLDSTDVDIDRSRLRINATIDGSEMVKVRIAVPYENKTPFFANRILVAEESGYSLSSVNP